MLFIAPLMPSTSNIIKGNICEKSALKQKLSKKNKIEEGDVNPSFTTSIFIA